MGLFKKTTDKVEKAVEVVSDKTTVLVDNANEIVEDNKDTIKKVIILAAGFFLVGIATNIVSIGTSIYCSSKTGKVASKPIIINNYIDGGKR